MKLAFLNLLRSKYLDGRLREAYHELLIDIHLGPHANTREHTQGEFIIPLTNRTKRIQLYDDPAVNDPGLPGMGLFTSLRPEMNWKTTCFVSPVSEYYTEVPAFPLNLLKHHVIDNLTDAVCSQTSQTRNWSNFQAQIIKECINDHKIELMLVELKNTCSCLYCVFVTNFF